MESLIKNYYNPPKADYSLIKKAIRRNKRETYFMQSIYLILWIIFIGAFIVFMMNFVVTNYIFILKWLLSIGGLITLLIKFTFQFTNYILSTSHYFVFLYFIIAIVISFQLSYKNRYSSQ